jgi:hypothetical protein
MLEHARAQWTSGGDRQGAISLAAEGTRLTVGPGTPAIRS